ncbi:hypothetical protein [Pseudoalteromonas denitrificans]|uniref:Uncharacterized protein n=1 Tax=Pseudoalteromonas denitrificans DSM 6059 TaxID=1123010 RepID=A0A1I1L727_9GAMM|nr:hypothetical protein [Pseudoalteromonas denitrificans]SFC68836.1 hypothetical protein SAMN02745724_02284 [Pseudoalteromonas denitrificans DSM 6059]
MISHLFKLTIILFFLFTQSINATQKLTSNHVYSEALALKKAIDKLNKNMNIGRIQPIELSNTQPLHVYAITTALNEKVAILFIKSGVTHFQRTDFPNEEIQPKHVYQLIKTVQKNIKTLFPNIKFENKGNKEKHPADVLRMLVASNLILDELITQKLTPKYPFLVVQNLKDNLRIALKKEKKEIPIIHYEAYAHVEPRDVFINAQNLFATLANTAHLKFGIEYPKRPYYIPLNEDDIKPSHVFTVTIINQILLKDLFRRNGFSFVHPLALSAKMPITPAHVYAAYEEALLLTLFFIM